MRAVSAIAGMVEYYDRWLWYNKQQGLFRKMTLPGIG